MTLLVARDVHVRYGAVEAVRGASFEVPGAGVLAVTGSAGAGKTSLLWALAGALTIASGEVLLDDVAVHDRRQAATSGIVLVPQGNALSAALTARENVLAALLSLEMPYAEAAARADAALEQVGLTDSGGHLVEELSGGQQQRVAVARALATPATVLLADEPTSDLDAGNRTRVLDALLLLARAGTAVVLSTHDPVAAAAARAELHLDDGVASWVRPWP